MLYQLSYMGTFNCLNGFKLFKPLERFMERETGLEPATPSLEGWRSSQLSYSRMIFSDFGLPILNLHFAITNRIHTTWWGGEDSNLRRLTPTDLQSVPFGRSGTSPGTTMLNTTSKKALFKFRLELHINLSISLWFIAKMEPPKGLEPPTG